MLQAEGSVFTSAEKKGWCKKQGKLSYPFPPFLSFPFLSFSFPFPTPSIIHIFTLGGRWKTWKKRWFVLKDNCLYYFKQETDVDPYGIIPLENLLVRSAEVAKDRKW